MELRRVVRLSLFVTAPANVVVGFGMAFPASPVGVLLQLPASGHPFYALMTGALVALFGVVYAVMAVSGDINRGLLAVGAAGKGLAVIISTGLFLSGQLPLLTFALVSGDLLFVGLWASWLFKSRAG